MDGVGDAWGLGVLVLMMNSWKPTPKEAHIQRALQHLDLPRQKGLYWNPREDASPRSFEDFGVRAVDLMMLFHVKTGPIGLRF